MFASKVRAGLTPHIRAELFPALKAIEETRCPFEPPKQQMGRFPLGRSERRLMSVSSLRDEVGHSGRLSLSVCAPHVLGRHGDVRCAFAVCHGARDAPQGRTNRAVTASTPPCLHDWRPSHVPSDVPRVLALRSALEGERLSTNHRKRRAKAVLNILGVGPSCQRIGAPVSPRDRVRASRSDLKDHEVRRREVLVVDRIGWPLGSVSAPCLASTTFQVPTSAAGVQALPGRLAGVDACAAKNTHHGGSLCCTGGSRRRISGLAPMRA
jgi:hypothetical protein